MKDISYEEHVSIENQLFESRFKKKRNYASWIISLFVLLAIVGFIGAFMFAVQVSLR